MKTFFSKQAYTRTRGICKEKKETLHTAKKQTLALTGLNLIF